MRLLDYPAWLVEVNGRRIVPQHAEDTAQMVVPIGAGNSELRVVFVRTWDRTLGITVTLVSAAIAIGMLAWKLHGAREIQGT